LYLSKKINRYSMEKIHFILLTGMIVFFFAQKASSQDTTDLIGELEKENMQKTTYAEATFKTTRIVDGQSVMNLPAHVLDVRISHRFGPVSSGLYNLFGLDNASMRLGFDYGITNYFMIGVGHSTYQKTYDAFFKFKILRQSKGEVTMPVTLSFLSIAAVNTLRQSNLVKTSFGDRFSYVYQLLIGRKFSEGFALQIMPTYIHADSISFDHSKRDMVAMGIGGRYRLSKRVNFNFEYYYQLPGEQSRGAHNVFSFGVDLGTGGHVFQLDFTNSNGLTEKSFITETTGKWEKRNIMFGFNISRVFQLKKK